MSKNIHNLHLSKQQEALLKRMIAFDSLELGTDADALKTELYKFFFAWRDTTKNAKESGLDDVTSSAKREQDFKFDPIKEEQRRMKEQEERDEKKKKA
jgi:hypothetical protein